jgi:hypothetical protein
MQIHGERKTMPDAIDQQQQQQTRADTYRWPQKVKRYGLEAHPFLRLFVGLYENTVPWNLHPKGWDADLLNAYIRERLLPGLKPTVCTGPLDDPFGGKYYLQSIALEAALQADEHAELVALRARLGEDPDGVWAEVLRFFNKRKQVRFTEWWNFMSRVYSHEPAWMYCVLKSVFDDCGRGVRRAPDRLEERALEKMTASVRQGALVPGIGLASQYVMERMGLLCGTARYLHEGWTRIPGVSTKGPSEEGVRLLAFLGRKAGWCVASEGIGRLYLNDCDFFVMCTKDRPVVGARIGHDSLYEAAGYRNGRQDFGRDIELLRRVVFPSQQWGVGSRWAGITATHWTDADWHEALNRFPFGWEYAPGHLRRDPGLRQQVMVALVRQSALDPFWARFIPGEFSGRPEFLKAEKMAWLSHLKESPVDPSSVPSKLLNDPEIVRALESGWGCYAASHALETGEIPEQILRCETFKLHWTNGWKAALLGDPRAWSLVPGLLQESPSVREAWIEGWRQALRRSSGSWSNLPEELRELPDIKDAWTDRWKVELRKRPRASSHIPHALRDLPQVRRAWIRGWANELRALPVMECPDEIKELPIIRDALLEGWTKVLSRSLEAWNRACGESGDRPGPAKVCVNDWEAKVRSALESWRLVPAEFKELPSIQEIWLQYWEGALRNVSRAYAHVPMELRKVPRLLEACTEGVQAELRRSPERCFSSAAGLIEFPEFWAIAKVAVMDHLEKTPVHPVNVPDILLRDSETVRALQQGWQKCAASRAMNADEIPVTILVLGTFKSCWAQGWTKELLRHPGVWAQVPQELTKLPDVREARINGWEAALEIAPGRWTEVPDEIKELPHFLEVWKRCWADCLALEPKVLLGAPGFVCRDKALFARWESDMRSAFVEGHLGAQRLLLDGWTQYASLNPDGLDQVLGSVATDASFLAAWRESWMARLNAPWTRKCLGGIREQEIVNKVMEGWAKLNAPGGPNVRSVIPEGVREALESMAHDRLLRHILTHPGVGVLRWLEENPWRFQDLPQGQKDHPMIWSSCRDGWLNYLAVFPVFDAVLPAAFSSDTKIKAALKRGVAAKAAFEARIQAEERARFLEATMAQPGISDEQVPAVFAENDELRRVRLRHWRKVMRNEPMKFPLVPGSLRQEAKLLSNFREALGPQIRSNPLLWETLPDAIRADECLQRVHRIATRGRAEPVARPVIVQAA